MGTAWARHVHRIGTAWARLGHGISTAWARHWHGMGKAWARHGHGMLCVNQPLIGHPKLQIECISLSLCH